MKYRTFGVTATPHGRGHVVVHSKWCGNTRLLSSSEAHLLLACDHYAELHDHAARNWLMSQAMHYLAGAPDPALGETNPVVTIERQLQAFVEEGFLVSEEALRSEIMSLAVCRRSPIRGCCTDRAPFNMLSMRL